MLATNQKGISLLFIVLIMSVILAISFGISAIFFQQTKMLGEIGHSVISFYAADSGVEFQLYDLYKSASPQPSNQGSIDTANFNVVAKCSPTATCPVGFEVDSNCDASSYCIKSIGSYQKTKRAIEAKY